MKNIVFAFDGQGSQNLGLGFDLINQYPIVKETFNEASDILNKNIIDIGLDESFLCDTEFAQVYIITLDIALYKLIKSYGIIPNYTCGFSLGEYASLVCANVISFEDVIKIVSMRGKLMKKYTKDMWSMISIIGLKQEQIEKTICRVPSTYITNVNTALNNVIVTKNSDKDKVIELLKECGAKKIKQLRANIPFHTPELSNMNKEYEDYLAKFEYNNPTIPLYRNIDSCFYEKKENIINSLVKHNIVPVQFKLILEKISRLDDVNLIEIGYSDMLCKMAKHTCKDIKLYNTSSKENIDLIKNEIIGEYE